MKRQFLVILWLLAACSPSISEPSRTPMPTWTIPFEASATPNPTSTVTRTPSATHTPFRGSVSGPPSATPTIPTPTAISATDIAQRTASAATAHAITTQMAAGWTSIAATTQAPRITRTAVRAATLPLVQPTATQPPANLGYQCAGGQACIKGNINSQGEKIYHYPGCASYDRTEIDTGKGERWFVNEAEAQAAGWRRAGNC